MNIVTTIKKYFDKVGTVFYKWVDDRIWKERMEKALRDVDNKDMRVYLQACLTNQMHSQRMQNAVSSYNTSFNTRRAQNKQADMMFDIATQALKKFWAVSAIVGVQPMSGPVSLVYRLVYKAIEDNQIRLEVCSAPVSAGTRRLRTRWSYEAMQDVQTVHSVDMEQDLKDMLSTMIVDELIAEVVNDLQVLAKQGENVQTTPSPDSLVYTDGQAAVAVNNVANNIGTLTRRGAGNFVIGSPLGIAFLQSCTSSVFVSEPTSLGQQYTALTRVGTLNGTIAVYMSLAIVDDLFIVGYKGGGSQLDTGYFACPYVPVLTSGVMMDSDTFQPIMALMTRYGKFTFSKGDDTLTSSSDYYGLVTFGEQETVPEVDQTVVTQ